MNRVAWRSAAVAVGSLGMSRRCVWGVGAGAWAWYALLRTRQSERACVYPAAVVPRVPLGKAIGDIARSTPPPDRLVSVTTYRMVRPGLESLPGHKLGGGLGNRPPALPGLLRQCDESLCTGAFRSHPPLQSGLARLRWFLWLRVSASPIITTSTFTTTHLHRHAAVVLQRTRDTAIPGEGNLGLGTPRHTGRSHHTTARRSRAPYPPRDIRGDTASPCRR